MIKKVALLVPFVSVLMAVFAATTANAFTNVYPDPSDSAASADVVAVNGETRYVLRTDGTIRVWFPNNSGSVEIRNGNFCNGVRGDYSESEDSTYASWPNGANITRFNVLDNSQSFTGQKGVNCNASHTFTFNSIPESSKQNGYYYRDIDVTYVGGRRGPMNSFVIAAPGQPNVRIGLPGDQSGFQATQDQVDSSPQNTQYRVPFGMPCGRSDEVAELNFFDLDNAGGSGAQQNGNVTVRLFDRTAGSYVNFRGGAGTTWTPPSRDGANQSISFDARSNHKYRLEINNVYHNNTIQYSIPYAQIFSEPCAPQDQPPTGTIISAVCTANNGQRITFRVNDPDGSTQSRIRVGSGVTTSWGNEAQRSEVIAPGTAGMDFTARTYAIRLDAKNRNGDTGTLENTAIQVDGPVQTQRCGTPPPATGAVTPNASLDASSYEVGGSATGTASYSSTFRMPTPPTSHGFTTEEYRGLFLGYTSRMWYDDGSETYPASGDVQTNVNTQSNQQVGTPATNSTLNTWPRSPLVLQPPTNPNFKICVSMTISAAYYEKRTRTVYWVPPVPAQKKPPRPAIPGYWTATAWSGWSRVNVPYDGTTFTRCAPIYRYPSMQVKSGDIKVGGTFKNGLTACTRTVTSLDNHAIVGHSHAVASTSRGSKGQYGVLALGGIKNFGSNDLLAPLTPTSAALTFGNGSPLGNFYGGATGVNVPTTCFNETFAAYPRGTVVSGGSGSLSATDNANTTFNFTGSGGTLSINGGTVGSGVRRIIRVSGGAGNTVVINSNINFAPVGAVFQMPQFILLVDGDIDIKVASGVTLLNGLFVTKGHFATCGEYNNNPNAPNIYLDNGSPCRNKLTINGAVITNKSVQPYRTNAVNGSDYTDPAEVIDLKGNILISDYARKQQSGNFMTIGQQELPPRF